MTVISPVNNTIVWVGRINKVIRRPHVQGYITKNVATVQRFETQRSLLSNCP